MANFSMVTWEQKQVSLYSCCGVSQNKNSDCTGRYQDMVYGQCLRTVDWPTPLPSPTPPVIFAAHNVQHSDPFPSLPASPQCHSPAALIHYPSPLFKNIFQSLSLSSTCDPAPCTARPASLQTHFILVGLCSVHATCSVAAAASHCQGGHMSFSLAWRRSSGTL